MEDKEFLLQLVKAFKQADREGGETDIPEGTRFVKITDTLLTGITNQLEAIANRM